MSDKYIKLDNGTLWPNPLDLDGLQYKLRYHTDTVSENDMAVIADYLDAYRSLFEKPVSDSMFYIKEIRKIIKGRKKYED